MTSTSPRFLMNFLLPGDTILADRGFYIQESVGFYCARDRIPSFTKGRKQLTGIEVEQTQHIANVRIHVERGIGVPRQKYTFLSKRQLIDFLEDGIPLLDKIVIVCCALVKMCNSMVPLE